VLLARRADALKQVAEACADAHKVSGIQGGGKVATIQIDVSDKAQVSSVLSKIPDELKLIDVLGTRDIWYSLQSSLYEPFHSKQRWLRGRNGAHRSNLP